MNILLFHEIIDTINILLFINVFWFFLDACRVEMI